MVLVSTVQIPHIEPAQVLIQSMHPGSPSAATTMSPPWVMVGTGRVVAVVVGAGFREPPVQAARSTEAAATVVSVRNRRPAMRDESDAFGAGAPLRD
jgi:hypothetical protein